MRSKEETEKYLKGIVLNLPETPGCYQYLDENGTIIYVGKAKNLKRRVSSYFNKDQQTRKTTLLVSHIRDIRYVVVRTEEDALLLDNSELTIAEQKAWLTEQYNKVVHAQG